MAIYRSPISYSNCLCFQVLYRQQQQQQCTLQRKEEIQEINKPVQRELLTGRLSLTQLHTYIYPYMNHPIFEGVLVFVPASLIKEELVLDN
jgi:hypothetical protein